MNGNGLAILLIAFVVLSVITKNKASKAKASGARAQQESSESQVQREESESAPLQQLETEPPRTLPEFNVQHEGEYEGAHEGEHINEHAAHMQSIQAQEREELRAREAELSLKRMNLERLRTAVVMSEVLGKPVALRTRKNRV